MVSKVVSLKRDSIVYLAKGEGQQGIAYCKLGLP